MKLAAYVRVSTTDQAQHGFGLKVQETAIRKWAKANGHRIVKVYADEGLSGSNGVETREALYDALGAVQSHTVDALVIYNLDRLARRLHVQEAVLGQVWQAGGKVFSVEDHGEVLEDDPDDPMRTAMRQMRGVFAELERSMIRKRMRDGKQAKAKQGGYTGGGPPFGYRAEGHELVPDAAEQAVIGRMRELQAEGGTTRGIASQLNAEGFTAKRGRPWSHVQVATVLRR